MSDKFKTISAFALFVAALVFPLVGLAYGWWRWDVTTGFVMMAGTFLVLSILGGLLLISVRDLSWLSVYMPFVFGTVYGFLPDAIPFSVDDAAATTAGAIFSFTLALRKEPNTPKWIFLPLVAAGIYAFFGGAIPGPIDEFLVDGLALILAFIGTRQGARAELEE